MKINIRFRLTIAGASPGLHTRQARDTLIRACCVLTLLIGTSVWIQTLIYVCNVGEEESHTNGSICYVHIEHSLSANVHCLKNLCLGTFTSWITVRLDPKASVTFTFVRAGQVHTLASDTTDVLLRALIHICKTKGREPMKRLIVGRKTERRIHPTYRCTSVSRAAPCVYSPDDRGICSFPPC